MKKGLLFLLVSLLVASSICAQSDFREGYIIKLSDDTLSGYINYKGNFKNLTKCSFKSSPEAEVVEYSPEEIKSFRFHNANLYVSMEVEVDDASKTYFLEQLLDGIVDVFYYSEPNGSFFIIRNEEGETYTLKNTRIEIESEEGSYVKYKKEYVHVLRFLFQDSPQTLKKLNTMQLNTNSMIDIAQDYHNAVCEDYECIVYAKNKSSIKLDVGLYAGYALSTFSLKSEYFENMNNDYSNSADVLVGLFLNVMDPNISERFSLQLDLIIQEGKYVHDTSSFEITYLKVPVSMKYTYPASKLKPAMQLGFSYNNWIGHKATEVIREQVTGDAIQKRSFQYGVLVGAECSSKIVNNLRFFAQIRYEYYWGKLHNSYSRPGIFVSEYVPTKTSFASFSLGLKF